MEENRGLENYNKAKRAALMVIPIQIIAGFCLSLQEDNLYLCAALLLVCVIFLFIQLKKTYSFTGGFWYTMKHTFALFISIGFGGAVDMARGGVIDERVIGRIGKYVIIERREDVGNPVLAILVPFIMCSIWFSCFFTFPIVTVFLLKNDIINN